MAVAQLLDVRRIAHMEAQDIYRLLARRMRRGLVIFGVLFTAMCITSGVAEFQGHKTLAGGAFVAVFLFLLGFRHIQSRVNLARIISTSPQIVYWAHQTVIPPNQQWLLRTTTVQSLALHLRDGRQFEACLSPQEMESFIAWLKQSNPSIRFGAYDQAKPGCA